MSRASFSLAGFQLTLIGRIWVTLEANGMPLTQNATANSVSNAGALLSVLSQEIRWGDLLWVEYQQRKARFKIVWVGDSQSGRTKRQFRGSRRTSAQAAILGLAGRPPILNKGFGMVARPS